VLLLFSFSGKVDHLVWHFTFGGNLSLKSHFEGKCQKLKLKNIQPGAYLINFYALNQCKRNNPQHKIPTSNLLKTQMDCI
jgi:hypothetical protein